MARPVLNPAPVVVVDASLVLELEAVEHRTDAALKNDIAVRRNPTLPHDRQRFEILRLGQSRRGQVAQECAAGRPRGWTSGALCSWKRRLSRSEWGGACVRRVRRTVGVGYSRATNGAFEDHPGVAVPPYLAHPGRTCLPGAKPDAPRCRGDDTGAHHGMTGGEQTRMRGARYGKNRTARRIRRQTFSSSCARRRSSGRLRWPGCRWWLRPRCRR